MQTDFNLQPDPLLTNHPLIAAALIGLLPGILFARMVDWREVGRTIAFAGKSSWYLILAVSALVGAALGLRAFVHFLIY